MFWMEKWLTPFRIVMTFSICMKSLGRSN